MTDPIDPDLAEAQRELDEAAREAGVTIGGIRAPGGATPDALRAVAKSIRQLPRDPRAADE